jgi:hypothetical protein
MKSQHAKYYLTACAVLITHTTLAANITWNTAFELISDTDIAVPGTLAYAVNAGDDVVTVTTSGGDVIPFEAISVPGFERVAGYPTLFDMLSHRAGDGNNIEFSHSGDNNTVGTPFYSPWPIVAADPTKFTDEFGDPFIDRYRLLTGNADLDQVLDSTLFTEGKTDPSEDPNNATAINASLRNLTAGAGYYVQVIGGADDAKDVMTDPQFDGFYYPWCDDPADPNDNNDPFGSGPLSKLICEVNDGNGNTVYNLARFGDLDKNAVSHVITATGTFVADSSVQVVNFVLQGSNGSANSKKQPSLSAIILTEILFGDVTLDKQVTMADYLIIEANLGTDTGMNWTTGDLTGDGAAGMIDLAGLQTAFGDALP